jgi:hypothetical protein
VKTREHASAAMASLRSDREGAQDVGKSCSLIDTMVQKLKFNPKHYSKPNVMGLVIASNPVWKQEVETAGGFKAWLKKSNPAAGGERVMWIDGPSMEMGGRLDLSQVLWPAGPGLLVRALPRRQLGHSRFSVSACRRPTLLMATKNFATKSNRCSLCSKASIREPLALQVHVCVNAREKESEGERASGRVAQHTTHNTQHTTHNTQHTTHNTQHTTLPGRGTPGNARASSCVVVS